MSYIWDVAIKLKHLGIDINDLIFEQPDVFSPYVEVSSENVNTIIDETTSKIYVNSLYRFHSIFQYILDPDFEGSTQLKETVFNIVIKFLLSLDLNQGYCFREYAKSIILHEVKEGLFGEDLKEDIDIFKFYELDVILDGIFNLYMSNLNLYQFNLILKKIFKNSITYIDKEQDHGIFIHIGEKYESILDLKLQVIIDLFLPIRFNEYVSWDKHFPVLGADKTMIINNNVIF